jgi:hypothetical protein
MEMVDYNKNPILEINKAIINKLITNQAYNAVGNFINFNVNNTNNNNNNNNNIIYMSVTD